MTMNEDMLEQAAALGTPEEVRAIFKRTFGTREGEDVLLYILVKIGGIYGLRFKADANSRLILDGKAEAAIEIMTLAGYSPFNLARRVMALPAATPERSGNETLPVQDPAARPRRRARRAADPIPASAVADAPGFAGDAADASDPARPAPNAASGGVVD